MSKFIFVITDILILLILLWFISSGFKNGMIKSILLLINSIFSWIASIYLSDFLTDFIYKNYFEPSMVKNYQSYISQDKFYSQFPDIITRYLSNYGITIDKINHIIGNVNKSSLSDKMSELIMPAITDFLKPIISIIVFIIIALIGKAIIKAIMKVFKLRIIGYLDKFSGSIFGGIKGYLLISIMMFIVKVLIPLGIVNIEISEYISEISYSTIVFKYMYNNNPIHDIFQNI